MLCCHRNKFLNLLRNVRNQLFNYLKLNNSNLLVLSLFILFFISSYSNSYSETDYSNSCLIRDSNGKLIYNKDSNKKCILIRTIDSNTRNKLSNEGLEDIIGKGCTFDVGYNYPNAEQISGQYITNGETKVVKCNTGYSGDIKLKCNNGTIENISETGKCIPNGCKKYDSDNILNDSYKNILENRIDIYLTNTDIDTLKEQNKNTEYNEGDVVDTILCNPNESDYVTDNGGWTIKCNGSDKFIVEGSGCAFKSGSKEFNYTGGVQTFTIPKAFTDRSITLEVWGAQGGGGSRGSGGKGGYSYGEIYSPEYQTFYIDVGGAGGYNGSYGGGGGGSSQIRISSNSALIVAGGGGGGAGSWATNSSGCSGGAGGGGGNNGSNSPGYVSGKTDGDEDPASAGGSAGSNMFGAGGIGETAGTGGAGGWSFNASESSIGGKGSFWGGGGGGPNGGGGRGSESCGGGGGGSYISNLLSNSGGSNGQRSGNGYAKISW